MLASTCEADLKVANLLQPGTLYTVFEAYDLILKAFNFLLEAFILRWRVFVVLFVGVLFEVQLATSFTRLAVFAAELSSRSSVEVYCGGYVVSRNQHSFYEPQTLV